ncbi:MAG TPA: hypothetical protein QGI71_12500, partial [Dehalococcoidia bacterium]|nr:hypothetical protein [Dehalococcoidia bacterium]
MLKRGVEAASDAASTVEERGAEVVGDAVSTVEAHGAEVVSEAAETVEELSPARRHRKRRAGMI